ARIAILFFFQAEDGIRGGHVTGVQTCALPIYCAPERAGRRWSARSGAQFRNRAAAPGLGEFSAPSRPAFLARRPLVRPSCSPVAPIGCPYLYHQFLWECNR